MMALLSDHGYFSSPSVESETLETVTMHDSVHYSSFEVSASLNLLYIESYDPGNNEI